MRVLTDKQSLDMPGSPYLYIQVTGLEDETATGRSLGYVAFVCTSLRQVVWLERNPAIRAVGETWEVSTFLSLPPSRLRSIREEVTDQVDQFINAYLAVNPLERPPVASPAPKTSASDKRDIQQAQGLLKAGGFDPGPADGALGERTRTALRQYQQASGLPVTGVLDQATQEALAHEIR